MNLIEISDKFPNEIDCIEGQYKHMKKTWANEYMRQLGLSKKKLVAKIDPVGQPTLFT